MTYPDVAVGVEAVRLVLVLLDLLRDLGDLPALAEVDDALRPVGQEVRVSLLSVQDVCQVHA